MKVKIKEFIELSPNEIYEILRLRAEVFVVEQDCVYQDIDGKDQKALHILGYEDEKLIAYARCFNKAVYFEEAAIGRVVVQENYRKFGYGHQILEASVDAVKERFKTNNIKLSAQQYLIKFYESHAFKTMGDGYLEDGIPHIAMRLKS